MAGNKSSIEAGRAHVTLSMRDSLAGDLDKISARLKSFGATVGAIGLSIGAAAGVILAPFLKGLETFSEFGKEAYDTMRRTGVGFEQLHAVMLGTRVEGQELGTAFAKMNEAVANSDSHLRDLGLDLRYLQSLDTAERFYAIADALQQAGQEAPRFQRAIFGRGALNLNLQGGAAGVRERAGRDEGILGQRTSQDVAAAYNYSLAVRDMKNAIDGVFFSLGRAALPAMKEFAELVVRIVVPVREWIDQNRYLLDIIFRIADKVAAVAIVIGGLAAVVYGAGIAVGILATAIKFTGVAVALKTAAMLVSKPVILAWTGVVWLANIAVGTLEGLLGGLVAVLAVVGGAFAFAVAAAGPLLLVAVHMVQNWDLWRQAIDGLIPRLERLWATIKTIGIGIGAAIYAGDWLAAAEIAWIGIKLLWERGINYILNTWDAGIATIAHTLVDLYEDNEEFVDGMIGAFQGFALAIEGVTEGIKEAFAAVFATIQAAIDALLAQVNAIRTALGLEKISAQTTEQTDEFNNVPQTANERFEGIRNRIDDMRQERADLRAERERALEDQLEIARREAEMQAFLAETERNTAGVPGTGGGFEQLKGGMVQGGFSAGQLYGIQAGRQVDMAQRQRQQIIDIQQRVERVLNDILRRVAPQFG